MDPMIHSKKLHLFSQAGHGGDIQIKGMYPERRQFIITDHRDSGSETGLLLSPQQLSQSDFLGQS